VAKASGGAEASQLTLAVACSIVANFESRSGGTHTWRSRASKVTDDIGSVETRDAGPTAEARQVAEAKAIRTSELNLRSGISNSQEHGGMEDCRPHSKASYGAIRGPAQTCFIYLITMDLTASEKLLEEARVKTIAI
jgi:hypothetical protein